MTARLSLRLCAFTILVLGISSPQLCSSEDVSIVNPPLVAPIFTDNMVLQRQMHDPIWGWSAAGSKIDIEVKGSSLDKHASAVSNSDGAWIAKLPILPVGGPYEIIVTAPAGAVSDFKTVSDFKNVLCGDVWLCSGQSNMQFGVGPSIGGQDEINTANYPRIRILFVNNATSPAPSATAPTMGWDTASPQTLAQDGSWGGFSGVGWYFGKGLYQDLNIPIGLIGSYYGGTPAEAWTSADALTKAMPDIAATIPAQLAADSTAAKHSPNIPSVLFNAMVNPLIPYGIKGAIWYQGESNVGRGYAYRTLLPTMIGDWRSRWNKGNFPFLIVQLAGYKKQDNAGDDSSAEVREAQDLTARNTPNCGIATAVDIGDPDDIHPKNKAEVGRRLDLVARAKVYHEKVIYSGPTYKSMTITGNMVRIDFDNAFGGLVQQTAGPISGFSIAGADHKWYWADAQISNKYSIIVSSPNVPQPIAVRYAWAGWVPMDLYNNAGLPVMPFRTDDWKLWSQP
jgi:sialate O-acetylesterase